MKYLYNRKGLRRGDGERHPYAFFVVGVIVVMIAVFVIGLQVGRVIEKGGAAPDARATAAGKAPPAASEVRKDLGAFSRDAVSVPVVPPPDARVAVKEVEDSLTFRETLSRKEDAPTPLERSAPKDNVGSRPERPGDRTAGSGYFVQAGAYRDKGIAEARRKALEKAGYAARVVKGAAMGKEALYRVLLGPFAEKEAARKAKRRIRNEMKIDAFVLPG